MRKRVADLRTDSGSETASAYGRGRGRGSVVGVRGLMRTQHFWIRTPLVHAGKEDHVRPDVDRTHCGRVNQNDRG